MDTTTRIYSDSTMVCRKHGLISSNETEYDKTTDRTYCQRETQSGLRCDTEVREAFASTS